MTAGTLLLLGGAAAWLNAAPFGRRVAMPPMALQSTGTPTIGPVSAIPTLITVNTPTPMLVSTQITDSRLIIESVNLLRINPSGNPTVLGVMKDDGKNGDSAAGDKTFSLRVNLSEATPGQIGLQVSAAFRGILRRSVSTLRTVDVWASYTDGNTNTTLFAPPLGTSTYFDPTHTDATMSRISVRRKIGNDANTILGISIYKTIPGGNIRAWFSANVDWNNVLSDAEAFRLVALDNGLTALILARPVPPSYLTVKGPVASLFLMSQAGDRVVSITPAQEYQPADFGFDNGQTMLSIAVRVVFP